MIEDNFKVARFTKDFYVEPNVVWFAKGELVLLIDQNKLHTNGNYGWCIVPQKAEDWNGCTLSVNDFEEHGFIEHTNINPKEHQSYEHVVKRFSDRLTEEEQDLAELEEQASRLREMIRLKREVIA